MIVRASCVGDIVELQHLEAAAARRFLSVPALAFLAAAAVTDYATHAAAIEDELAWKVEGRDGRIKGFCYCQHGNEGLYLAEISTHPDFQRQGVGAALLAAVFAKAQALGVKEITLTTYRDVAWNAPWYQRHGFSVIETERLTPELTRCLAHQRAAGLMVLPRCAMRYLLGKREILVDKPLL